MFVVDVELVHEVYLFELLVSCGPGLVERGAERLQPRQLVRQLLLLRLRLRLRRQRRQRLLTTVDLRLRVTNTCSQKDKLVFY